MNSRVTVAGYGRTTKKQVAGKDTTSCVLKMGMTQVISPKDKKCSVVRKGGPILSPRVHLALGIILHEQDVPRDASETGKPRTGILLSKHLSHLS